MVSDYLSGEAGFFIGTSLHVLIKRFFAGPSFKLSLSSPTLSVLNLMLRVDLMACQGLC